MIFLEVNQLEQYRKKVLSLNLTDKYKNIRVSDIQYNDWGNEFFVYDPMGILWHIGEFKAN